MVDRLCNIQAAGTWEGGVHVMVEMVGKVVVFWGGAFGAEKRCRLGCHDAPKTIKNKGRFSGAKTAVLFENFLAKLCR